MERISHLFHKVGETHPRVFRVVDSADDNWATWYADWLVNLPRLPSPLGAMLVRNELTYLLMGLDKEYNTYQSGEPWQAYMPSGSPDHFSYPGS
jgi:hypothetical protein